MRARRGSWLALTGLLPALLASCAPRGEEPAASPEPRPPVEVSAAVDRAVATLGDRLTYTLTVDRAQDVEVEVPSLDPDLAGLTVRDAPRREVRAAGERVIEEHRLTLRVDDVGSYVLPPVTVRYGDPGPSPGQSEAERTVETSPLFIEVESILERAGAAGETVEDIRGLKPLERPGPEIPWGWLGLGGSLAVLFLGWLLWLRNRKKERLLAPSRPAHEVALERLEALAGWDRTDRETVHRLHFELSETIRIYFEDRFGLNATDLTTEEIVVALPTVSGLSSEAAIELRRFLIATDRVKFADHHPSEDQIAATLTQARSFVEATRAPEPESQSTESQGTESSSTESEAAA